MKRFLLGLSIFASFPLAIAACSSSSSSSSSTADGGGGGEGGATADGGGQQTDGGGAVKSDIPGDPPSGTSAPIEVTINGQPRVFDGQSTWTKFPSDAGEVVGFQTNATANGWMLLLAVFGNEPGAYDCAGGVGAGGGVSIHERLPDGGHDPNAITYGATSYSAECTITLESYSAAKGGHVTGTFTAELDRSSGNATIDHLSLTNGKFDLVNYSDVPQ